MFLTQYFFQAKKKKERKKEKETPKNKCFVINGF